MKFKNKFSRIIKFIKNILIKNINIKKIIKFFIKNEIIIYNKIINNEINLIIFFNNINYFIIKLIIE